MKGTLQRCDIREEKRRIAVVTGGRAEYGLLYWLLRAIDRDPDLELQLIVTGMHLVPEFGLTVQRIESDGFKIAAKVEMLLASDTAVGMAKSLGLGIIGYTEHLACLQPDLIVLLGDRYEMLAAAQAALILRIPMAHLHGGELSEGALDDAFRHAITKFSHWHFVAAETYRQRVIQLGESPERVFTVGALGLDHLTHTPLLDRVQLKKQLNLTLQAQNFLITYHPATLGNQSPQQALAALFSALDHFPNALSIFTRSNADTMGRIINHEIEQYVASHPQRAVLFSELGNLNYLSLMKIADVVIGNSSSGIIEAPALRTATINLGSRQKGRLRADSVIDCPEETEAAILSAIRLALSPAFQAKLQSSDLSIPYGGGGACERIQEKLKTLPLEGILQKSFFDLGVKPMD